MASTASVKFKRSLSFRLILVAGPGSNFASTKSRAKLGPGLNPGRHIVFNAVHSAKRADQKAKSLLKLQPRRQPTRLINRPLGIQLTGLQRTTNQMHIGLRNAHGFQRFD